MNKLYNLVVFFCFSLVANAQITESKSTSQTTVDPRIVAVFGSELSRIQQDPQRFKDLNDILFNRTEIIELAYEPNEKFPRLSQMPLFNKYNPSLQRDEVFDKATFNVLKYNLDFFTAYDKIYRIDGTDQILIIHPQSRK